MSQSAPWLDLCLTSVPCVPAGYRTDRNKSTCQACLGCGPQEQYFNCADIRITATTNATTTTAPTTLGPSPTTTSSSPPVVNTTATAATSSPGGGGGGGGGGSNTTGSPPLQACTPLSKLVACEAKGIHRLVPGMGQWCLKNCLSGKCRDQFCSCFCNYTEFKVRVRERVRVRVRE